MSRDGNDGNEALARLKENIIMGRVPDPVRDTRFKPGQSGNPRGRPRRAESSSLSIADQPTKLALIKASKQKLQVREGDRIVEMDAKTALAHASHQTALKGSPYMLHRLLDIHMKIDREEAREREESRRVWTEYKEHCSRLLEEERKAGVPLSVILPHPGDVIIEPSGAVRFAGPMDEAGQKAMEQSIAIRDLLMLQEEWDCRSRPEPRGPRDDFIGTAYLLAYALDRSLPPRLRLTEGRWILACDRARCTPTRELLKILFRGWRALGLPFSRGRRFPDREKGENFLKLAAATARLPIETVLEMSEQQFQEAVIELAEEHAMLSRTNI